MWYIARCISKNLAWGSVSADAVLDCERTCLCVALSHALAAGATTLDVTEDAVDVASATPLLVGEDVAAEPLLASLHKLHVGKHALVFESARQLAGDCCRGVNASKRDELEDEASPLLVTSRGLWWKVQLTHA